MKQWYLFYTQGTPKILHHVGAEGQDAENQCDIILHQFGAESRKAKNVDVEMDFPSFFAYVPWRQREAKRLMGKIE